MKMAALMMEAARTSEKLVNFYQTARHYNPEDSHLRTSRCENHKSYLDITSSGCSTMMGLCDLGGNCLVYIKAGNFLIK
jgi:hypothetical protein